MLNKLFFNIDMTWKKVIIFAIACAVFSALTLIIPFTIHSSLSNIGTYLESWILFALIIIMNCKKPLEAGLKTFVFFLISQPLIYLLQVPFSFLGWKIFMYYPMWGIITVLTFPGAMIAFYVKKDNILSSLILSIATCYLAFQGVYFLNETINRFPHNILSAIYCFVLIIVFAFSLLKQKKNRYICLLISGLALVASTYILILR